LIFKCWNVSERLLIDLLKEDEKEARSQIEKRDNIDETVEVSVHEQSRTDEEQVDEKPVVEEPVDEEQVDSVANTLESKSFACTDKTVLQILLVILRKFGKQKVWEQKALLGKSIRKISEITCEQHEDKVVKVFLKLPAGYSGVRPATDDNIKLVSKTWKLFGKIASCSGFKNIYVTITAKPNSDPAPPECDNFTLFYVVNNHNYRKMKESVKKISEAGEEGSVVASVILGKQLQSNKENFSVIE
jgi:hypothetical protein